MSDVVAEAFRPLLGRPCWGVERVHGSILSFEFGSPRLSVREPYVSTSSSPEMRRRAARRRVKAIGDWNLFVFCCRWRACASGVTLAEDEDAHDRIEAAARSLDGQILTAFAVDATTRAATFSFDLGATLATWPYEGDGDEQWSLAMPDGRVLTYRSDGRISVGSGSEQPGREAWQAPTQSTHVP